MAGQEGFWGGFDIENNPHKISAWDYLIRVPLEKKRAFREKFPQLMQDANAKLAKIPDVRIRVNGAFEILIGPDAGAIEVRWDLSKLAELEREDVGRVIEVFDGHIREFLEGSFSAHGRVLGVIAPREG